MKRGSVIYESTRIFQLIQLTRMLRCQTLKLLPLDLLELELGLEKLDMRIEPRLEEMRLLYRLEKQLLTQSMNRLKKHQRLTPFVDP